MTVRCDACGTENRDKAMFCRGCAGKLPSFVATIKPSAGEPVERRTATLVSGASMPSDGKHLQPVGTSGGSLFNRTGRRIALSTLLVLLFSVASLWFWFVRYTADTGRPASAALPALPVSVITERLPPEAALSAGETLDEGIALGDAAASHEIPRTLPAVPDSEPMAPSRGTGRRPTAAAKGSGWTSDPRVGCEHLFFAFAARCEANHCQQPAYARHPRCDAVREQNRRDEARRNSIPLS